MAARWLFSFATLELGGSVLVYGLFEQTLTLQLCGCLLPCCRRITGE